MALRHFTVTIPTGGGPVNIGDALGVTTGKDDIAYGSLTFELSTGTKVFIGGDNTVSASKYGGSCTTSKVASFTGAIRLGNLWAFGTANDVLQIGAVPL